jgi:carotene epsilon-monooxygenase
MWPQAYQSNLVSEACRHCSSALLNSTPTQAEVDRVLGGDAMPNMAQYAELKYIMRCVNESMRLYPHPPVLLRRALVPDTLPGGYEVAKGQDVMISVYNIHHSPQVGPGYITTM